jgi:hypothetical protein
MKEVKLLVSAMAILGTDFAMRMRGEESDKRNICRNII